MKKKLLHKNWNAIGSFAIRIGISAENNSHIIVLTEIAYIEQLETDASMRNKNEHFKRNVK